MEKKTRILVCGGGNGAHTLAALASTRDNVEVNVMSLYSDEAERWSKIVGDGSIVIDANYTDGRREDILGKPALITNDPAAAMKDVDAIFFVVPAYAHQQYFDAIRKYIKPNTIIVGMPGQAGFDFQALKSLGDLAPKCAIINLESLPWACRLVEFGSKVQVLGFKDILGASLIPGEGSYILPPLEYVQILLAPHPQLKRINNYLALNLMGKSMIHPPILYAKWSKWDGIPVPEEPLIYQAISEEEGNYLSAVSDEVLTTAKAIQTQRPDLDMTEVMHISEWFKVYYKGQITDDSTLTASMRTNKAYDKLKHPMKKVEGGFVPDFDYRYTSEDVPYGVVVMKGIATCAGVKTPTMDTIIAWAQKKLGKEYIVGTELKGKDMDKTRAPQIYGFNTVDDLCKLI